MPPSPRSGAALLAGHVLAAGLFLLPGPAGADCPCDCNDDGNVAINELITAVNIALGTAPLSACPNYPDDDLGGPPIVSLTLCINLALSLGCPGDPLQTPTPGGATLPALLDDVAPRLCADVVSSTPGGAVSIDVDAGQIDCSSLVGHRGWVRFARYASAAEAAAALGVPVDGEEVADVGGGRLRNLVSRDENSGGTFQDWRWQRDCWLVAGYAFDDTHFAIAPQPHPSVALIAASPLFADLAAECAAEP